MSKKPMSKVRKRQIIKAVLEYISNKGIDNLTLESVAQQANISKGIITYYFKSKKNLILESYSCFLNSYDEYIKLNIKEDYNASDIMNMMFEVMFSDIKINDLNLGKSQKIRIIMQLFNKSMFDDDFKKLILDYYNQYFGYFKMIFNYGIENKEFDNIDVDYVSYILMSSMDGLLLYNVFDFKPIKEENKLCSYLYNKLIK